MDDVLLQRFVAAGDQEAFAGLMAQHLDWVYGAALRQVGNHHLAQDIAQAVFVLLSRKAAGMAKGTRLTGWLFKAVRYAAMNARTTRRRRARHEQIAARSERDERPHDWWERIGPVLDDAVARLSRTDRELVLARFYENRTYDDIARGRGISADGVRKRLTRAVAEMGEFLRSRAGELPEEFDELMAGKMASVAPAGLAATIAASVGGGGASAVVTTMTGKIAKAFWLAKMKVAAAVTAGIVAAGTMGTVGVMVMTGRPGSSMPVSATVPAPAAMAAVAPSIPKVAMSAERENAVYVSFVVLADDAATAAVRKLGTPLGETDRGELLSVENQTLRKLLRDQWGAGVSEATIGDAIEVHADKPRSNMTVIGAYVRGGPTALPDKQWKYQTDDLTVYTARAAGGRVQVSMDQKTRGAFYPTTAKAPALPPAVVSRVSGMVALGRSVVYAVPAGMAGPRQWYRLAIVQAYAADAADAARMTHLEGTDPGATMATKAWLAADARQWVIEARRATLWQQRLAEADDAKWVWTLPNGNLIRAECVASPAVSPSLVWSPDGGRVRDVPADLRPWPRLQVRMRDAKAEHQWFELRDGATSLTLGAGEGEFKQIATLDLKDRASTTVNGRVYRLELRHGSFAPFFDNDPAQEVVLAQLDAAGKPLGKLEGHLWNASHQNAEQRSTHVFWANEGAKSVGVFARPRYWHTFQGIAAQPAAPPPSDAEVMASFAKPLETLVPPQDLDQYEDLFAKLRVKTLFFQLEAPGTRIQWFADRDGREYLDLGDAPTTDAGTFACDGARVYHWGGKAAASMSRWRGNTEIEGASLMRHWMQFDKQLVGRKKTGEAAVSGVMTTVYEGRFAAMGDVPGKIWIDARGRAVKCEVGASLVISLGYDLPDDAKRFAIPEEVKTQAKDGDAGLPVVEKMTSRPAVLEKSDGLRTVRLHQVVKGEGNAVYICFSTQLDAKAAEAVRLAPFGDHWGRGRIQTDGMPDFDQYRAMPVAYIHAPDRSMQWWVLMPPPDAPKGPWRVRLDLNPGTPNCLPMLERAGFSHFGTIEFDLPAVDGGKVTALDDWLKSVHGDVRSYTAATPVAQAKKVKPTHRTMQEFIDTAREDIQNVTKGGAVSYHTY